VERVIRTTAGWVLVGYEPAGPLGFSVAVNRYDEDGWEVSRHPWWMFTRKRKRTLSNFIASSLDIPEDEARALTNDILTSWEQEWEARGGDPVVRYGKAALSAFYGCSILLILVVVSLALWGIALSIWLLAT